jgi:hypothetical protein
MFTGLGVHTLLSSNLNAALSPDIVHWELFAVTGKNCVFMSVESAKQAFLMVLI